MDGTFACPDCGNEVEVGGLSPGRQTRCEWCEALIEVPFIPRSPLALRKPGGKKAAKLRRHLTWAGIGAVGALVLIAATAKYVDRQTCRQHEEAAAAHSAAAIDLEKQGQLDQALAELDEALAMLRGLGSRYRDRLETLQRDRDQLSRRAAEIQLAAVGSLPPDQALLSLETLRLRVRKEPSLADLVEAIDGEFERTHRRGAEAELAAARRSQSSGAGRAALDHCDKVAKSLEPLTDVKTRRALHAEAEEIARAIIAAQGLVVEPTRGEFSFGSGREYDALFSHLFEDELGRRDYLIRRPASEWNGLWDSHAPYRLMVEVQERLDGNYLDSENRLTGIEARLFLTRGREAIWRGGPAIGRSPSPIPGLAAYQASQIAVGKRRPEAERLLYDHARAMFAEKFTIAVRGIPACSKASPSLTSSR